MKNSSQQSAVIYHNPRCSKSRETLSLLKTHEIDTVEIDYLSQPPSVKQLDDICMKLGLDPLDLIRTGETRFRELGLHKNDRRSRDEWLTIMHDNPILIERPIVLYQDRAVLGRPPQNVLQLIKV